MRRRTVLVAVAVLLAAPVVLLGLALIGGTLWLQTDGGQRQAAGLLERAASGDGMRLEVGAVSGRLPHALRLEEVRLADRDGVWLRVDRIDLAWAPLALLGGEARVEALTLGRLVVLRRPAGPPDAADPARQAALPMLPDLPRLPVSVAVERLEVAALVLDAPVLGRPAELGATAQARLGDPADGLRAAVRLRRQDGPPGQFEVDLHYRPEAGWLDVTLLVEEPEDGLIAALADLPGRPPVAVRGQASGPIADWQLRLTGQAGPDLFLETDLALALGNDGLALTSRGHLRPFALLPPELHPLIGAGIDWRAEALLPDLGTVMVHDLSVTLAAGTLALSGRLAPPAVELEGRLVAGDPAAVAALVPGLGWDRLTVDGTVRGRFDRPVLTARLDAQGLGLRDGGAGPVGVGLLSMQIAAEPTAPLSRPDARMAVTASLSAAELASGRPELEALLAPEVAAALHGQVALDGTIDVERFTLTLPVATVTGEGQLRPAGPDGQALLTLRVPDLASLAPLTGRPLAGVLDLEADLVLAVGDIAGPVRLVWHDPATGIAAADAVLGERVTVRADLATAPAEGWLDLAAFSLEAAGGARLRGDATLLPGGLAAGWQVELDDLSALAPDLAGALALDGSLSGPLDGLALEARLSGERLSAGGRSIEAFALALEAAGLPAAPRADWRLAARLDGVPVDASGGLEPAGPAAPDRQRLTDLRLAVGGLSLAGALELREGGGVNGRLSGGAASLAGLRPVIGADLAGAVDVSVDLAATAAGRQDAALRLTGRGLGLADGPAADSVTLEAALADLRGTPRLDARLEAATVVANGLALETLTATAAGTADALALALALAGAQRERPLSLELAGRLGLGDGATRIALDRLEAAYGPERLHLAAPAVLRLAPGRYEVDRLDLRVREGGLVLAGRFADPSDLSLDIEALPVDLAGLALGDIGVDGLLDGSARITGRHVDPTADFSFRLRDGQAREAAAYGIGEIAARLDGGWRDGLLAADGQIDIDPSGSLVVTVRMPLRPGPPGQPPHVPTDSAASFRAEGSLDLALVNDLLAGGADRVAGIVDVDLTASGPIDGLVAQGHVILRDGRYENIDFGTRLTELDAELTGSARQLVVQRLSANTPGGGRLTGSGAIQLDGTAGLPVDVRLTVTDGRLVDNDLATVEVNADLQITGPALGGPLLAGRVAVNRAEARLPETLPRSVPTLPAYEVNAPDGQIPPVRAGGGGSSVLPALDLAVTAPQAVFLRGRGLDVEFGGDLRIGGTAAAPQVVGQLDLRRGTLDLLGRRFDFQRGTIRFDGGVPIDPVVELEARLAAREVTGIVRVVGRVSDLDITFASEPELPEDEVLARVLFNKPPGELTTIESVLLAQSLAATAGLGIGSIFEDFRRGLGIDRLTVQADDTGQGAQVEAGQYIADGVFLGVRQGVGADSSAVVLEIELTPNITVESDVGGTSGGRVGIRMEWDY